MSPGSLPPMESFESLSIHDSRPWPAPPDIGRLAGPAALETTSPSCTCNLVIVSGDAGRPFYPLQRGNIAEVDAHLLYGLKDLVRPMAAAKAEAERSRKRYPLSRAATPPPDSERSANVSSDSLRRVDSRQSYASSTKGPRPCVIWSVDVENNQANVLLMGTFGGSSWDDLHDALKQFVIGVYSDKPVEDWENLDHIHTSPTWPHHLSQWLIPISVPVPADELRPHREGLVSRPDCEDKMCFYVNDSSMERLESYHSKTHQCLARVCESKKTWVATLKELDATPGIHRLLDEGALYGSRPPSAASSLQSLNNPVQQEDGGENGFSLVRPRWRKKAKTVEDQVKDELVRWYKSKQKEKKGVKDKFLSAVEHALSW